MDALRGVLDREDFVWRGVYDDRRFDRHALVYVRKVMKTAGANNGRGDLRRYQ